MVKIKRGEIMINFDGLKSDGRFGYFYRILFMLLIPIEQGIYFVLNTMTTKAYDITIYLDKLIPFNEWFVLPYVFWYVYTFGLLLLFAYYDYKAYFRLLFTIVTGVLICYFIYYLFPTTVPRPEIIPDNILKKMVMIIYNNDKPFNCFPSIHILDTYLIGLYLFKYGTSVKIKILTAGISASIFLSTLFIKQHSILDIAAAVTLGSILFIFTESEFAAKKFEVVRNALGNAFKESF